jgi:peroxiredoxin Q/BCP
MPPELRKRKAPATEPAAAPPAKKKGPVAKAVAKVKNALSPKAPKAAKTNGATSSSSLAVGDTVSLEGFGGEIETNDGVKTTLKQLVDESTGGVVLFTYPKASTPGCQFLTSRVVIQMLIYLRYPASLRVPRPILPTHSYRFLYLRPL